MAYFICEKQGRCCSHEFYNSIEQAITDSEDGVPCDHLIEVAPVRHGQWYMLDDCANAGLYCSACGRRVHREEFAYKKMRSKYCPHCGARMDGGVDHA